MLRWSINLFRIRGIQLSLHGSFLLLLAYVAWEGWWLDGWPGLLWSVAFIVVLFTCVILHELGHCFMARRFGVHVPRILLLPIGGMAEFDSIPRQPRSEILIALAGPAVNFGLAALALIFVRFPSGWMETVVALSLGELGRYVVVLNLVMGTFNLAPVFPMDGGRVLRALLATRLSYVQATFWAASVGKVLAVAAAFSVVYFLDNWLGGVLFIFIFIAGEIEYRAVRRREREEAHWQRILIEFYGHAPGTAPPEPLVER
jgi:Zn-dependent protease